MDLDTPATADPADETSSRDEAGRFLAGRSGNPLGRPVGSRRVLARALAAAGVVAVVLDPRRPARPTSATVRRPRRLAA